MGMRIGVRGMLHNYSVIFVAITALLSLFHSILNFNANQISAIISKTLNQQKIRFSTIAFNIEETTSMIIIAFL